ncbi:MAG: 2-isopropylmalate synthase [Candidatus Schekmanbacteria bacterium RIFCSPHIGHO2_02_FULL_38_11]|uniref:2-isopropylmalate synthase n=1 Tax=Candidatus Schekmanbacteria bacterium RIFCSPLOWO2_12_FULL_38_15 TaxID=1817883 RepID=A0A1F7SJU7_9BACT|nr:MAG: 2-isopropylmalate synthase [Candidatus Schekmanbacteria bacterium GWA2_38_9]OGL51729.1 MAG: 2-isopropylmalate synthase [Candidatus Schekmanbacteria bacterium RIFCSPLOWO2_02_FULL_38_14]OGL52396.1 MAG: 2-isopropylmalate synthase [Candidatus Schekmanbacteria bacterium RIFCSPHIGHO2_02_FULL_38_11]OGL54052.1 MAG: 2-isopropylmalate synthase [Candidatus Schekmanbacteria bacterium RIFCSPLOWO2_12_FULL_38_15]
MKIEIIKIFDTTLRDGEQSPGASLNIKEKLQMAKQLAKLKVDIIEAGFPIASPGDFEAVREIAKSVRGPVITGLARAKKEDIDIAWKALKFAKKPRIHTFIATSDIHMKYKLEKSKGEVLSDAVKSVKLAKKYTEDVEFSAEDASRSNRNFLAEVIEAAIDAGANTVNIPDTVGYAMPTEFGELIRYLKEKVSNIDRAVISVHCHNDLGLAVANSIAAIENGARQVECTVNGIGERAGNASIEEIVMGIYTRKDILPFKTNIKTTEIYNSSRLFSRLTGLHVQVNKAVVGKNAFAHEAGIHQHGMLKKSLTYEIMTPKLVGVKETNLVLGKHSGRHALARRYKELGYEMTKEEIDKAYTIFTELADKKKVIFNEDLEAIIDDEIRTVPEIFQLVGLQAISGDKISSTATVKIKKGNKIFQESAIGDGPVDASCVAIDKITKIKGKFLDYSIRSVSAGREAVGEALVKVKFGDKVVTGKAASTDVIFASAKGYLNALNKFLSKDKEKKGI